MPKPHFTNCEHARTLQHEGTTLKDARNSKRDIFKASYLVHYRPNGVLTPTNPDHDLAVAYEI